MTETRQLDAAFVERQRLFKRQVALLELLTIDSSSAIAASKSLIEVSVIERHFHGGH
jgi:hypothetical protein